MDETIDLRPYVEALLRRWWVILGAVIAGILVAVILYYSQTGYRATALVAVTDPTQRLQFDARIVNTMDLDILLQAYPELAMSDSVLSALLDQAREMTDGRIDSLPQLRQMLNVETGADVRLIRLIVHNGDPQLTADLANTWANTFVTVVDSIYLNPGGEAEFFGNQLDQTNNQLQVAERALVDFQSGSRMGIVDNELNALNELQAAYLAEQNRLNLVLDDIHSLRSQYQSGAGDTIPWADQLTALMLQVKVYEIETESTTSENPIQLQLDSQGDLTTSQREEQLGLLDELTQTAEDGLGQIDIKLLGLESSIFELQREKQDLFHHYEQLTRDRDIAKETYLTLARKIDEVRIQSEDTSSGLKVASLATPPVEPARLSLLVLVVIGALAGLMLGIGVVGLVAWWKAGSRSGA